MISMIWHGSKFSSRYGFLESTQYCSPRVLRGPSQMYACNCYCISVLDFIEWTWHGRPNLTVNVQRWKIPEASSFRRFYMPPEFSRSSLKNQGARRFLPNRRTLQNPKTTLRFVVQETGYIAAASPFCRFRVYVWGHKNPAPGIILSLRRAYLRHLSRRLH